MEGDFNGCTLAKYLNGPGIDNKLRMQTGSDIKYFLTDHLGSTNGLADSSGNLVEFATYDAFGNMTGNLSTRYQFTGREFDNATGLHYYRARWYDSKLGRFISEDPIGFNGGDVNLYGYVANNPMYWRDPSGLHIGGITGGGSAWLGAVVGGGATGGSMIGYSSDDGIGASTSGGYFLGPGKTPTDVSQHSGWAVGGGFGAGGGFFYSNANKWSELEGDFSTTLIGFGPIGTIQIDSDCKENGVRVFQVYPGPLSKGPSYGIAHLNTHTPPSGVFTLQDGVDQIVNGIRKLYGF